MNPSFPRLLLVGLAGSALLGQSFVDLTEARNAAAPFPKVFQVEAGAIGTRATTDDPTLGLDSKISWDGRAYFRDEGFGSRKGTLEGYAGRDGLFASYTDGKLIGDDTVTRFEVRARPWMFYRDGFYRGDVLVPNGFYEGSDYQGYIGFGRNQQGLYIEFGPYYEKLGFKRSELTPVTFTVPENYTAYGGRLYVEQSTVQMDRRRGMPHDGYVVTVCGEREWNDSNTAIGTAGFSTTLPSAVWRVRGRLEWYVPSSDTTVWEVYANGGWHDEKDRVQSSDSQRPLGNQWADAQVRLRFHAGTSLTLTPFVEGQYSRLLKEDGFSDSKKFFFGGGLEAYYHMSEALSLHAWYSYVDNDNRPSITIDQDTHGEQMFYLGMVLRLGATRR